jgi:hypothetical protein
MQEWLTQAERYRVERIACPHPNEPVDMGRPPAGVLHTTEGGWDGSLAVFRKSSAPHFMVGRDRAGKVRLAQLVPLGKLACALENDPGGIETNRWIRAQIELVGYSKQTPWKPDPKVADVLAALMRTLQAVCQIPLSRPFGDATPGGTWATETNSHRQSGFFGSKPGWYGHIDLPENEHWDPEPCNGARCSHDARCRSRSASSSRPGRSGTSAGGRRNGRRACRRRSRPRGGRS